MQSLIGQVKFLRRFIPRFVEILRGVTNMLQKYCDIKWTIEAKKYFIDTKKEIIEAPVLVSRNFSKDFIVFSFASEHTIAGILVDRWSILRRGVNQYCLLFFLLNHLLNFNQNIETKIYI